MEQNTNLGASGLSRAASQAVAVPAGLGAAERRAALEALGVAEARRIWTPRIIGELPTMTALASERDRDAVYGSDAWASAYRRERTVVAYVLRAPGLGALSARLGGVSVAKVGTASADCLAQRVADLGRSQYGAWIRGPSRYEREAGYDGFAPAPRLQLAAQHPASPVRLCAHGFEVDLPPGLRPNEFEATLNRALLPVRLQTAADGETGRALCARTGVETALLRRFYRHGAKFKAATELTLMRPQADIGSLARIAADLAIDAVLGLRTRRPVR